LQLQTGDQGVDGFFLETDLDQLAESFGKIDSPDLGARQRRSNALGPLSS